MASRQITARCVPDIYLTEERLQLLFNGMPSLLDEDTQVLTMYRADFNSGILQPDFSDAVFADQVNRVCIAYEVESAPHH